MESTKPGASQSGGVGGAGALPARGLRFSQLSVPRRALVRLCQTIDHGCIENLEVKNSEPIFDPLPVMLKDVKLDSDEGPRPELALEDFAVSDEVFRLITLLDEMKCGTIRRVEVRAGIPRRIVFRALLTEVRSPLPQTAPPGQPVAEDATSQTCGGLGYER